MSNFSYSEITKVLNALIGNIEPVGDTIIDDQRYDNLVTLADVTDWCLDGIQILTKYADRPENSMSRAGSDAINYLKVLRNNINRWLGDTENG